MDQKFAKWDGWLDTIYQEVVSLVEHQQIFRRGPRYNQSKSGDSGAE